MISLTDNFPDEHKGGSGEKGGGGCGLRGIVAEIGETGAHFLPTPVAGTVVALTLEKTKMM